MLNINVYYKFMLTSQPTGSSQDTHHSWLCYVSKISGNTIHSTSAPSCKRNMDSIVMKYLKYLFFMSLCIPVPSWDTTVCEEKSVPNCEIKFTYKKSGRVQSVVYEIEESNTDVCQLRYVISELYKTKTVTIRCLNNAPRIINAGYVYTKEQLVIEKCVIYWKDLIKFSFRTQELTLDDREDEFTTGKSYFYECIHFDSHGAYHDKIYFNPVTVNLLSSVAKPLSGALTSSTWPKIKKLSIKG